MEEYWKKEDVTRVIKERLEVVRKWRENAVFAMDYYAAARYSTCAQELESILALLLQDDIIHNMADDRIVKEAARRG